MTLTRRRFFQALAASALAAGVLPIGFPREAVASTQADYLLLLSVNPFTHPPETVAVSYWSKRTMRWEPWEARLAT